MTTEQLWLVAVSAIAGAALVVALLARRATRTALDQAAEAQARIGSLLAELAAAAPAGPEPRAEAAPDPTDYVITDLGTSPEQDLAPARIEGRLFADIVLRETVVKAASLAHGVRRALTPEQRLKMRAEYKREVRRSRKQRRAELKEARRHLARLARERRHARRDAATEDAA